MAILLINFIRAKHPVCYIQVGYVSSLNGDRRNYVSNNAVHVSIVQSVVASYSRKLRILARELLEYQLQ